MRFAAISVMLLLSISGCASSSESSAASTSSDAASSNTAPLTTVPPVTSDDGRATFHGFQCEEATCSGHKHGYEWAEERGIDDPHTCYSGPRLSNPDYESFSEGCEAYVDDSTGASPLDPSERYGSSDTNDDNGN